MTSFKKKEDSFTRYIQILNELKQKKFHPVYFLCGSEPYYINKITDYIEHHILNENERIFDLSVLYGNETSASQILSELKRIPVVASKTIVIVKEAQETDDLNKLESYILKPSPYALLAIAYKKTPPDARKSFGKVVKTSTLFFETQKLYDNQLPAWISQRVMDMGYTITPHAAQLLADSLGNDLDKIENELKKVFINLAPRSEITPDIVQNYIGISKEFNIYELQRALGERNVLKANQIIHYFSQNPKEHPFITLPVSLYNYFTKVMLAHKVSDKSQLASVLEIKPYFVREYEQAARNYSPAKLVEIISLLREYDLKAKGYEAGNSSDAALMKELIFKILH